MKTKENSIEVPPLNELKQEERIAIISNELISMKPKRQIIDEYCKLWQCQPSTVRALINESIAWLATEGKSTRDEIRALNSERLEELFGSAKKLNDKIKIINMLNKTYGIYDTNVNITNGNGEDFKIDLGI